MKAKTKGIVCVIIAAFGFSLMSMFIRLSGEGIPSYQKAFFRNSVALVIVTIIMLKKHVSFKPKKRNLPYLFGRAVFGTAGLLCNFYAIDHLVLADANMLNKLSPFFAIAFSVILLKERPNLIQIAGVVTAFGGSLCIIKPSFENPDVFPAVMGLLGGLGAGIAYTCVRKLGMNKENSLYIVFFFSAFSSLVCLPAVTLLYVPMSKMQLLYLVCAGIFASVGQFGITQAYVYAPAKEISVYDYTQVIFAAVIGFFIFNQKPDLLSVLGYFLICGAGIAMFFYNNRQSHQLKKES